MHCRKEIKKVPVDLRRKRNDFIPAWSCRLNSISCGHGKDLIVHPNGPKNHDLKIFDQRTLDVGIAHAWKSEIKTLDSAASNKPLPNMASQ